jgi:hypothetical protein
MEKQSVKVSMPSHNGADQHSVLSQIDALNRMSMDQLRKRWSDLFGTDSGRLGRSYLVRRLAYRIQELVFGGLSREARSRLQELTAEASQTNPQKPSRRQAANLQTGTRLLRDWHGERYEVIVQDDGFLHDGKKYRSLSAVARAITGSYWSGNRFFGLSPAMKNDRSNA